MDISTLWNYGQSTPPITLILIHLRWPLTAIIICVGIVVVVVVVVEEVVVVVAVVVVAVVEFR